MNKRGQSAVELAIFGSIFLFCLGVLISYGMSYNFQQRQMMQAYKETRQKSYDIIDAGNKGPFASADMVVINDKHIPDPQDAWGIGGFQPVGNSYGISVSNRLYSSANYGDLDQLPRIYFKINGQELKSPSDPQRLGYTIANFDSYNSPFPVLTMKISDLLDKFKLTDRSIDSTPNEGDGINYRYIDFYIDKDEDGNPCDVCFNSQDELANCADGESRKFDDDGDPDTEEVVLLARGMSADFNGDNSEEIIVGFNKDQSVGEDKDGKPIYRVTTIYVMDYTLGDMDTTLDTEDRDINLRPGLRPGYNKVATYNKSLSTTSADGNYSSTEAVDYSEQIKRTINLGYDENGNLITQDINSTVGIQR